MALTAGLYLNYWTTRWGQVTISLPSGRITGTICIFRCFAYVAYQVPLASRMGSNPSDFSRIPA